MIVLDLLDVRQLRNQLYDSSLNDQIAISEF